MIFALMSPTWDRTRAIAEIKLCTLDTIREVVSTKESTALVFFGEGKFSSNKEYTFNRDKVDRSPILLDYDTAFKINLVLSYMPEEQKKAFNFLLKTDERARQIFLSFVSQVFAGTFDNPKNNKDEDGGIKVKDDTNPIIPPGGNQLQMEQV